MKKRLDVLLVERAIFPSREQARTAIMTGRVLVDHKQQLKAGTMVEEESEIRITGHDCPYVSRGGYKLAKAVESFGLDLNGIVMADIGASSGGFTDCALQNGATRVYAVDVGYGQLAWSLRQDDRVIVLEKVNARYLSGEQIPETLDVITADVSFISLKKLIPHLLTFLKPEGYFILLIKPQFEAGRDKVGKKGVVRDTLVHQQVIEDLIAFFAEHGLGGQALTYSPIRGPEGNREYLLLLNRESNCLSTQNIHSVVQRTFEEIK